MVESTVLIRTVKAMLGRVTNAQDISDRLRSDMCPLYCMPLLRRLNDGAFQFVF